MKKLLLILSIFVVSLSAFAADLNPFAYGLYADDTDPSGAGADCVKGLNWELNAPATSMKVIIVDENGTEYVYREYYGSGDNLIKAGGYGTSVTHSRMAELDIPYSQDLKWRVDVTAPSRSGHELCGQKISFISPFSIDIDNNPLSPYFGRILTTQPLNESPSYAQGLYEYNPVFERKGIYLPADLKTSSGDWYNDSKLSPYRVRIAQDGSGRVFTTVSSTEETGYLYEVGPSNLNQWNCLLTKKQVNTKASFDASNLLYNVGLDIREDAGYLKLLLLSASVGSSLITGYLQSGEYDLISGNYTTLTSHKNGQSHSYVGAGFCGQTMTGNAQYDKNGDQWYIGSNGGNYASKSALIHRNSSNEFKSDYGYVKNETYSSGFRYNKDFSKLIIAHGKDYTAHIYNVDHTGSHPTLSGKVTTGTIYNSGNNSLYIMDFAWDYADNVYACVRNVGSGYGVYAIATDIDNKVISTPAANSFNIPCEPNKIFSVECIATEGGTVTGGGSVASCTSIVVTATPDSKHRFINWTDESDEIVSTSPSYEFFVVRSITLKANFAPIEYQVTWHNLLNNKNDSTKNGDVDDVREIYGLVKVYFNDYNVKHNNATDSRIRSSQAISAARTFFAYDANYQHNFVADFIEGFMVGEHNYLAFKWLGDYINTVDKSKITSSMKGWYPYLPDFFIGSNGWSAFNNSSQWLPYYWEGICGLPSKVAFDANLPVEIKEMTPKKSEITNSTVLSRTPYPTWYARNYQEGKLLAWRDGSTTGNIVHHVSRPDMQLYASYVDKALQEDDPTPTGDYDATNNDVLDLLANDNHGSTPHNVTVDRKFAGGMYNTVCFPFDLPITSLPVELRDADILAFTGVTKTGDEFGDPVAILNFIPLADYWQLRDNPPAVPYMEAGVPYLIKPKNDVNNASLTYTNLLQWRFYNSSRTPNQERVGGVTFQGVFNPTTITEENTYILVADNRLAKVTGNNREIKGYRGYFIINDATLRNMAAEGRVYFSFKKPVTTSIPVAPEAEQQAQPKVRKVMYDGQIYILRGEEVYTITGNRVK